MRRLASPILVILLSCGSAAGVRAADDASGTPAGADDVMRTEEILVETEVLAPAEIYLDTPVETEVITAEDLRTLPALNAIDALDAIPGIRIQSQVQGQRGAVRIDGLPPEFTEILVNGQRYSGENGEAIDLGDQLFANLARIEILRGPQALRYSPRAAGGVINLITKDPPEDGVAFSGETGGGDQGQAEAEATLGFGRDGFGLSLTYDFNQVDGFDSPNRDDPDPDNGLASPFGEGSRYRTHDVYATFSLGSQGPVRSKTRLGYRLRDEGFAIDDGPIESRRETERWLLAQETRFQVSDATSLQADLTYSREDTRSTVGRDFQITDDLARLQFGIEHTREIGATAHVLTVGSDLSTVGIETQEGPVPETIENPDLVLTDVDERFARGGVYAILESDLTEWFQSSLGVRYEFRDDFKPELLPQAAILITPWRWDRDRKIKLRLSAGRAVRYPTLRERFQPPVPQLGGAYFLAGSEDLDSETAYAVRASIEANPQTWVSGSVTGFYSETSNRIRAFFNGNSIRVGTNLIPADPTLCAANRLEFCFDQLVPVQSSVFENANLDNLESYGIEARLEFRPHELVELHLGYTWNRTVVQDSNVAIDELPNSPRHIASGRLVLKAPVLDTTLTARGQWRDQAIIENSGTGLLSFALDEKSNTSFELDLRLVQPLDKVLHGRRIDLFADLQNATDNRVIDSNVVRGRSFFIGLKWEFP